ncbi:Utp11 protein [Trichomonas vaginalis G3]|uniref:U3 small nucleolar RNA-associated protein 11 n=1 Tax=Trichomonas vaginalis (strain ATCC PRA-98 / G3) TaxID=412133 RepID=A2F1S7_TRIV3|nr:rRNA processing [Trichomonas vaginalis G3]EAY01127.1 Utp11 protein [Trichomonas vaginalis G3]KAI5540534.1 rRNA processing [Trichomonas vaginalis G3]|eukprot:XP_001313979.1 Utp11 protein [Trichomonas vaginalis G3]
MNSSKWKSPFQRKKRERQQPAARAHLGILEKKKDYIERAKIYHKHEKEIDDLRRAAELRNPNEFYYSMIGDMKEKPVEYKSKPREDFTKEQRLLLETRDINYIIAKMQTQKNKLEKLKIRLPIKTQGSTKIYSSVEEAIKATKGKEVEEENPEEEDTPDVKQLKEEIENREFILQKLQEVYDEMKLQADTKNDENYDTYEDDDGNVHHVWKPIRKR